MEWLNLSRIVRGWRRAVLRCRVLWWIRLSVWTEWQSWRLRRVSERANDRAHRLLTRLRRLP